VEDSKRPLPFVGLGRGEWERLGDAAALLSLVLVALLSGVAVYLTYGQDFRGYYAAARVVLAGGDPYDYRQVADVLLQTTGYMGNNPYYYPPWLSLAMAPLGTLPWSVARGVWIAVNWGLLLGGLALLTDALDWRVRGWRRWLAWLSAFYLFGWVCLKFEQLGIVLFVCLAWALWAVKHGRDVQAGLAMALLLTKPNATLLAFVCLVFVSRRARPKAALWTMLWLAVLAGGGTLLLPGWLAQLGDPDFGLGLTWLLDGPGRAQSPRRLCTLPFWLAQWGIRGAPLWIVYAGLTVAGLWLAVTSQRLRSDLAYGASVGATFTLLLTPYALMYDYAVLMTGLLWAYRRLGQGVTRLERWLSIAILAFLHSVLLWAGPEYDGYWLAVGMGALLAILGAAVREPGAGEGFSGAGGVS
jgi:hypothetical protein